MGEQDDPATLVIKAPVAGNALAVALNLLPIPTGAAASALAFNYAPAFLFTDDTWSKYLVVILLGIAVASCAWALRGRRKPAQIDESVPEVEWTSPPVDTDRVSGQIVRALVQNNAVPEGWCHYLGDYAQIQVPSALSSAFALRTLALTGFTAPGVPILGICDWICSKSNPDGGWAAQSQGDVSRPEVTAIVASTLARFMGENAAIRKAARTLETAMFDGSDPMAMTDTYVNATVLEEARFLPLSSVWVKRLAERLLDGSMKLDGGRYCWSEVLFNHDGGVPSSARTAHAVLALQSFQKGGHDLPHSFAAVLEGALTFLEHASKGNEVTKLVRYPSPGHEEVNAPRHFTAALISTALGQAGRIGALAGSQALESTWSRYRDGLWLWDSGAAPTYVTYYGLLASITGRIT